VYLISTKAKSANLNERKLATSQHKTEDKYPEVFKEIRQQKPIAQDGYQNSQQHRHHSFYFVLIPGNKIQTLLFCATLGNTFYFTVRIDSHQIYTTNNTTCKDLEFEWSHNRVSPT